MKRQRTIQLAGLLLAALPTFVRGGESARLTISGYVPPMQRVAAVQSSDVASGKTLVVLQEQNNSALGYTLTVASKTLNAQTNSAAALEINFAGLPVNLTANGTTLPGTPSRAASPTAAKVLEISPSPASARDALVLTVASQ